MTGGPETILPMDKYWREVTQQASYLNQAVEESGGTYISHLSDTLDAHDWFDGSNEPALHARIITLADAEVPLDAFRYEGDSDTAEELMREMAHYVFSKDVHAKAKESK